jgi:transposase
MTQVKTLDFSGQPLFCGIDMHKKSWSVCLRNHERELKTFSQDADPAALVRFLNKYYPNAEVEIAYEAGFCGFWVQQQFVTMGLRCRVIHPADLPQPDRDRRYKTDVVDSRRIAFELSKGGLNGIYVPSQQTLELRALVRGRVQLIKDQTRFKNRIISFLDFFGIRVPEGYKKSTHFSHRFMKWLEALPLANSNKMALQTKIHVLGSIREQLLTITRQYRLLATSTEYGQQISLLGSIPGIGLNSALVILTEIGDMRRFRHFDQLASLAGFKPDIYSSAERSLVKGITYHCNHLLRETLVECAWMGISKDPALTQAYYGYKHRMHYNKAILRIAKKLLSRVRYVMLHQRSYQLGRV